MADETIALPKFSSKGIPKTKRATGWGYIVGTVPGQPFKVGHTHSVERRLVDLQAGNPVRLICFAAVETESPRLAEARLMMAFRAHHLLQEWYSWGDHVEQVIDDIKRGCGERIAFLAGTGRVRLTERYENFTQNMTAVARRRGAAMVARLQEQG